MEKKKPKFLRRSSDRYSKLGIRRKKKQKWKRPNGRDNKMREKRRGYPAVVSIGYGTGRKEKKIIIMNVKDLEKIKENQKIIVGRIGRKNKIEIAKTAKEKKIKLDNLNVDKFLKSFEKKSSENIPKRITAEDAKKITEKEKESKKI